MCEYHTCGMCHRWGGFCIKIRGHGDSIRYEMVKVYPARFRHYNEPADRDLSTPWVCWPCVRKWMTPNSHPNPADQQPSA